MTISITRLFNGYYKFCQCGCKELIPCVNNGRFLRFKYGHHNYKNGRIKQQNYISIYKPHFKYSRKNGYIQEHRYIMYIYLSILNNRPIYIEDFDVHHINGNKIDNRIINLQLLTRSEHLKLEKSKNYCSLCSYNIILQYLFKNNIYYDNWNKNINNVFCDDCTRSLEYFKNRFL